ncbi:ribulose-phosphate 3-epimerase [uncultured Anaerococcus sp.]|uniref:ribulose-phosphate 3-epimerase n=1 Tax=uncultured Anaerococcus sp. TaxID=293428 RepID=UPI00288AD4B4|nr:ribulose-phosphate 3-epimerase [uncultured Anaerococcus sp.]
MVRLAPSILSANFANLQGDLDQTKDCGLKMIHIDIMDGTFVPNISFGFKIISDIRDKNDYFFDTHLMIGEPIRYIEDFKKAGSDRITVHYEACKDLRATLKAIRDAGMEVGLTAKPETDPKLLLEYFDQIDLILVMSVRPGFGGQKFMAETKDTMALYRKYIDENNLDIKIEVDGGIKTSNVREVLDLGVDEVVVGSDVFAKDIRAQIKTYHEIFKDYE